MFLFSLAETVRPGIAIDRDEHPSICNPPGCSAIVLLSQAITDMVERLPPGVPWLKRANATIREGVLILEPFRGRGTGVMQAIVHIGTAAGVRGKVFLRSSVRDEELVSGWVRPRHQLFPPVGVQPLCKPELLAELNKGVDMLDLLVMMNPGARFRIERTGKLEGASPLMFVRWSGREDGLSVEYPRGRHERADFAEAAAG